MAAKKKVATGVYKVREGVYDLMVSTGRGADGKYGSAWQRFEGTLTQAKHERGRMLSEVADETLKPAGERLMMAELHDRYLKIRPDLTRNSREQYLYLWSLLDPHIGKIPIRKLRAVDLDHAYGALADGKRSPNTIVKAHKYVSSLLTRAVDWELVPRNVAKRAHPPAEVPFNVTPPSKDEKKLLVQAAKKEHDQQFPALVHLACTTGARRGELGGLRWCDVNLDEGTVRFRHQAEADGTLVPLKTKKQRVVPIDDGTIAVLKVHREFCDEKAEACGVEIVPECFVFSPKPGNRTPYRVDGLTERWNRIRKATGVDVRLHDTRHAQATQLLAAGVSPVVVAQRLGMSVEVLMRTYGHADEAQNRRAANLGGL